MIANDPAAKGRQKLSEGQGVKGPVKLPDLKNSDARDAAGKASTPLPLSSVRPMPPTRCRASSRDGEGMGMGLVGTENKKSYLAAVLSPCWFLEALVL